MLLLTSRQKKNDSNLILIIFQTSLNPLNVHQGTHHQRQALQIPARNGACKISPSSASGQKYAIVRELWHDAARRIRTFEFMHGTALAEVRGRSLCRRRSIWQFHTRNRKSNSIVVHQTLCNDLTCYPPCRPDSANGPQWSYYSRRRGHDHATGDCGLSVLATAWPNVAAKTALPFAKDMQSSGGITQIYWSRQRHATASADAQACSRKLDLLIVVAVSTEQGNPMA